MGPSIADTSHGRTEVATSVPIVPYRDTAGYRFPATYGKRTTPFGDTYG